MKDVPAVPYMHIVKLYALASGLPFFTLKDMITASYNYNLYAQRNN